MSITIATHSGSFHADDVFAVATLLLKYPDARVIRTRDSEVYKKADIVVDVGGVYDAKAGRFDHHQEGRAGTRDNGIPYASFGLVWKEYGSELAGGDEEAKLLDEKLIMSIDAPDNAVSIYQETFDGVAPYTVRDFLYSYVINEETDENYLNNTFMKVVGVAKELLEREIVKVQNKVKGIREVESIIESSPRKDLFIIEKPLPWEAVLTKVPEALLVVYARKEGTWGAKGVLVKPGGFERRKYFPMEWAGKSGEELQKITGVPDAMFCHINRFLVGAQSKEGALKLAEIALKA